MKKEIEVTLPNGYTIGIFEYEDDMIMELINPDGFCVSDAKLTETEIKQLEYIFTLRGKVDGK